VSAIDRHFTLFQQAFLLPFFTAFSMRFALLFRYHAAYPTGSGRVAVLRKQSQTRLRYFASLKAS
jgi:hypothetical protein